MDTSGDIPFRTQLLRDNLGEFAVAGGYLCAWALAAWLPDRLLLALVVGIGLQFFVVTMLLGAVVPRGGVGIAVCVLGHALLFAFLAWVASAGGRQAPDLVAVAVAQLPLLVRNLERLWRPRREGWFLLFEAIGPFFLMFPVILVATALAALLPDPGLAAREIRFTHLAPLPGRDIGFALLAGALYFAFYALARTGLDRLGGGEHERATLTPATIKRWREDYEKSKK
jgi:hypothetical protein